MSLVGECVVFLLAIALLALNAEARVTYENGLKSMSYLSPKITQYPGFVSNKIYFDVDFPKGHIALKSFRAEIVDEAGNPVSLKETYVHHWVAVRYFERIGVEDTKYIANLGFNQSDIINGGNAGVCGSSLPQVYGIGSETRKTFTHVPDPYGLEFGNPLEVPSGYEEKWRLNIHAMDTRDTVDTMGCTECRCNLYNVTNDMNGRPLDPDYVGGLGCCYDGTQCKVKNEVKSAKRNVYLKYTVKWVDWSDSIIPAKIFVFDVTDTWQDTGIHECHIEYAVEQSITGTSSRRTRVGFPIAGDVVYGVAHLHSGGIASALYKEDGQLICLSKPIYGKGNDVGDEAGYVVGMSTCYPKPGSVKLGRGETLTLETNYSSEKSHTGLMGIFYLLVADASLNLNEPVQVHNELKVPILLWGVGVFGLAICAAVLVTYQRRKQIEEGYQPIAA